MEDSSVGKKVVTLKINSSGIRIYRVKKSERKLKFSENDSCSCCFNPRKQDLLKKPLITESDIDTFDFKNKTIKLTDKGAKKLRKLKPTTEGIPVVLTLNGQIICGFWLWFNGSSVGCERVIAYNYPTLRLRFGLPSNNTFGDDPRFDDRLRVYLED